MKRRKRINNFSWVFRLFLFTVFIFSFLSPLSEPKEIPMFTKHRNRLAKEKSPYLLQHADNPVDWYAWGDEAFRKAKAENKPVFLSIGYSTCHWCHVMEHESFVNEEIAKILNDHFVSIKVDREERPDIDNIYMTVVMAMTGSGGWPMSVFLTPDKKPFYGGTYFPPTARWGSPGFKDLLLTIHDNWQKRREEIVQSSQAITEALQKRERPSALGEKLDQQILEEGYRELSSHYDARFGGFGQAPKFPMGHNLSFILRYWKRTNETKALEMVENTLLKMAEGGIYDHLGGGFHRYSTDREWQIPHFEKMLYDQAILVKAYLEVYQATGNERYAQISREVLDYVTRDMQSPEGGFYSAEDADSLDSDSKFEKREGAFYLWTQTAIEKILSSEEEKIFIYHFGIESNGNAKSDPHGEFVGKNVIFVNHSLQETAQHFNSSESEIREIIEKAKAKLQDVRLKRPRPHLDDKILVDWNGLMISSLAFASRVLNEKRYANAATKATDFILEKLVDKNRRLLHRYREEEAAILATLDDYAFLIQGLIDVYEATFEIRYLKQATQLTEEMIRLFWDEKEGGFFFTAKDSEKLLFRQKEVYDGAIPSGNGIALLALERLSHIILSDDLMKKADLLCQTFASEIKQRPSGYTQFLIGLDFAIGPSAEIVLAEAQEPEVLEDMIKAIYQRFFPNKVLILRPFNKGQLSSLKSLVPFIEKQGPQEGKTTIYVCQNRICQRPITSLEQLSAQLK